jgi:hypothetical protein
MTAWVASALAKAYHAKGIMEFAASSGATFTFTMASTMSPHRKVY